VTDHDALVLVASTLDRLVLGMRPFWGAGPGAAKVTVIENGCTRFLRTFVSIAMGRPNRNAVPESGYVSHNADRIDLSLHGDMNLDGEIIHAAGTVRIEATDTLRFLRL
jgi:hypothetical protein